MAAPKLRNSDWNSRLKKLAPYLDGFQTRLDDISNDIKALEKYLTETGFRIAVFDWAGEEGLAWTDRAGTWRLCYATRYEEHADVKPLLETPAATRLWAAEAFPSFLDELARAAGAKPEGGSSPTGTITDDDIPF
ncbi:MAG: hypothetical protein R2745_17320 [Vicinamibacterales bacterium]